jgi:hypothetical protein
MIMCTGLIYLKIITRGSICENDAESLCAKDEEYLHKLAIINIPSRILLHGVSG